MQAVTPTKKSFFTRLKDLAWIILGSFLAALSIRMFLYPNHLIDGGVVGISLILGRLTKDSYISLFLLLINIPFIFLAYRYIRKAFIIQMLIAVVIFAIFLSLLEMGPIFHGDALEIIVIGGAILGIGAGLVIRHGACLDGSEILAIIINKRMGFTVGQVVLIFNIFVFAIYGILFFDWHIAVKSLLTYIVAFKMMDLVIVGLEEIKAVSVVSSKSDEIMKNVVSQMGLGLTIMHGRGGYSGDKREILNIIVERLDLADLKDLILRIDPDAFVTVTNVYEVIYGHKSPRKIRRQKKLT